MGRQARVWQLLGRTEYSYSPGWATSHHVAESAVQAQALILAGCEAGCARHTRSLPPRGPLDILHIKSLDQGPSQMVWLACGEWWRNVELGQPLASGPAAPSFLSELWSSFWDPWHWQSLQHHLPRSAVASSQHFEETLCLLYTLFCLCLLKRI